MHLLLILLSLHPVMKAEITGPESPLPGALIVKPEMAPLPVPPEQDEIRIMPGWPKRVPGNSMFSPCRGVALADFDNDGRQEIIMPSTAGQLYVWRYDGSYYPNWPRSFSYMGQYAPAVADIDRDGEYEIAICTRGMTTGGGVYVFNENGTVKNGWPFTGLVNGNFADSPTLADIDGDDTLEIIVGERDWPIGHLHVLRHNGVSQPGAWPCSLDHVPALGAAVADINRDGQQEIVYASYNSLYVFRADGSLLPGWPVTNPNGGAFSYQSPALADLDGDDTLEIVIALHRDGQGTYAFRHDGTILSGWPYRFARWTYCPPTVADLYQNSELKVICGLAGIIGGAADVLYAFDNTGSTLNGFPIFQPNGDAAEGNVTVADIDNNGDMEIIFTSNMMNSTDTMGYLYAVHHDGTPVAGWPLRTYGFTYLNGATCADVDGDDSLDIVTVSYDNNGTMAVTVWETDTPFTPLSCEWPTYQFDMARTGRYQPPPVGIEESKRRHINRPVKIFPAVIHAGSTIRPTPPPDRPLTMIIYDRSGRKLTTLVLGPEGTRLPGQLSPGVYFIRIPAADITSKLLVVE